MYVIYVLTVACLSASWQVEAKSCNLISYQLLPRVIFIWPLKMVSVSVRYLFYQSMDEKIKTWTLRFPAKENPNMEKALFDWPIVLQYDVKAQYPLISRKYSSMKFFHPNIKFCLTNQSLVRLYPFDKPIKFLCFGSFVVSVLFVRFHFKVIRKSLYHFIINVTD